MKIVGIVLLILVALVAVLALLVWVAGFHPPPSQDEAVTCAPEAAMLKPGQTIKILSWNVQFMAGKNYVFYYDLPGNSGPHERPSREDIDKTLREVARVIVDEKPDLVLLQEVDDGARRTDYEDQLARLIALLPPGAYPCHASAFYWKSRFIPHPRILGAAGLKLSTLSRFRVARATRLQLPRIPQAWLTRQFYLKRAVLEVEIPIEGAASSLRVMNTHLDAFTQGTDTMERQVEFIRARLAAHDERATPWVIGGDFNLLPPGVSARERLAEHQRGDYAPTSELAPLYARHHAIPSREATGGREHERWFTYFSNDPRAGAPDRTIDYVFAADRVALRSGRVRQDDTRRISDHFPVVVELEAPPGP